MREFDRWLFGYGSPLSFGVFRAVMAGIIFVNALMLFPQASDWFTDAGFAPSEAVRDWLPKVDPTFNIFGASVTLPFTPPQFNPLLDAPAWASMAVLALLAVSALLCTLGLFTRASSIAMFVSLVAIHHRDPLILNGGDTLQRACAFYLAIGPGGAAFSLDRLLKVRKGQAPTVPPPVSLWPQRLVQMNMALLYLTTVWLKWQGPTWKNGTATWYTARLGEFQRFPLPDFLTHMPMVTVTTYGTLFVELALATLVFAKDFRRWVLGAGLLLHATIEYSMNIPLFAFTMCSLYIAFYEGEEVAAWWDRLIARFAGTRVEAAA